MHNENTAFHSCEELVLFPRKLSSLSTGTLKAEDLVSDRSWCRSGGL